MFNDFLTLIWSVFPFLKELILGNQTVRDVILKNKLFVFLLLLFLFMMGSNLYMDDTVKYLRSQIAADQKKITEIQTKNSVPPQLKTVTCPGIASPAAKPQAPPPVEESPQEQAKDREIERLRHELSNHGPEKPKDDPLDRLYGAH